MKLKRHTCIDCSSLKRNFFACSLLLWLLIAFSSCSNTRYLSEGDALYVGSTTRINDRKISRKERKALRSEIKDLTRPKPNTTILGLRVKLWLYNIAGKPKKEKGFRHWLRNKAGEPPVLASSVPLETNAKIVTNILQNRGFFNATAQGTMVVKRKRATAIYDMVTGDQYRINEVSYFRDSSDISRRFRRAARRSLLKPGEPYNLQTIKAERDRLDRILKRRGYYFYKPEYAFVKADTAVGDHKVNMSVQLKKGDSIPDNAYTRYHIGDVYVYPGYRLRGKSSDTDKSAAVVYKDLHIIDRRKQYRPQLFDDILLLKPGDIYNKNDENATLGRLVNVGTFKFVKNRFEPSGDSLLDIYYYLSNFPKKSIRFELGGHTQNDSRLGTTASLSWRNRNTFKGAEEFMVKLNGGIETQYGGNATQPAIYNYGIQTGLTFPYFVVPFVKPQSNSIVVPRTIIKAGYTFETQSELLKIKSYKISYGYNWKENVRKEHQLYPINFTYVKTDTLNSENIGKLYGNLIFDGIIIGPTYEFTYNSQASRNRKNSFYFDGLIDFSGNILGLAQKADAETNPQRIFNQPFAQYMKFQTDFRYYRKLDDKNVWANRIFIGVGIPYGNSVQMPNIKQFFSGGNSSLRGFRSRLVGPGSFNEEYLTGTTKYIQTLGDIKLELNSELRTEVYKFFKVGLFVDAGNIWLYRDNPNFPGGTFSRDFYRELAMDMGFGLRFDFSILLVRLDIATPIRKPWLPEGDRWSIGNLKPGDPDWRSDNLVFNLAIGYPF